MKLTGNTGKTLSEVGEKAAYDASNSDLLILTAEKFIWTAAFVPIRGPNKWWHSEKLHETLHFDWQICLALRYCGWLYFRGYQLSWIEENDTFLGFKIHGHSIFLHISYKNLLFRWYWNSRIGPSAKTMKISTPQKLSHLQYPNRSE